MIGYALRELALIRKDKHDLAGAVDAARKALDAARQRGHGGALFKRVLGCLLSDLALAKTSNGATESIPEIMKLTNEAEELLLTGDASSELISPDKPRNETAKALDQLTRVYQLLGRSNELIRLGQRTAQSIAKSLDEAERLASGNKEMLKEVAEDRAKLEAGKLKKN